MKNKLPALATGILSIGIIGVLCSPFVFTRSIGLISFTETGQIGDTIGGLTAPVVGLVSSILVYLALLSQVEANAIVQGQINDQREAGEKQKNFDSLIEIYRQIKDDLDTFNVVRNEAIGNFRKRMIGTIAPVYVTYSGIPAIGDVLKDTAISHCSSVNGESDFAPPSELGSLVDIAQVFEILTMKIRTASLLEMDKETLKALVGHLYKSRIERSIPSTCPRCYQLHDVFPEDLNKILENLHQNISDL